MTETQTVTKETLPEVIETAQRRLVEAKTSAEVLKVKKVADAAYHCARVTKAGNELTGDALVMISLAEIRLAQEIDAGQQRGEVATRADGSTIRDHVPNGNKVAPATYEELGVSRKQVHDWRRTAKAGEQVVRKAVTDQIEQGRMPTKADVRRAVEAVVPSPPPRDPAKMQQLSTIATSPDFQLSARVDGTIREVARTLADVEAADVIDLWSRQFVDPDGELEAAVNKLADFFTQLREYLNG